MQGMLENIGMYYYKALVINVFILLSANDNLKVEYSQKVFSILKRNKPNNCQKVE